MITFILLLIILLISFYITRMDRKDKKNLTSKFNISSNPTLNKKEDINQEDINQEVIKDYNDYLYKIEKYNIGDYEKEYNNPNAPYSNHYRLHPKSFIPEYRQPIDSIVPDDYPSTLNQSNLMYVINNKIKDYPNYLS